MLSAKKIIYRFYCNHEFFFRLVLFGTVKILKTFHVTLSIDWKLNVIGSLNSLKVSRFQKDSDNMAENRRK